MVHIFRILLALNPSCSQSSQGQSVEASNHSRYEKLQDALDAMQIVQREHFFTSLYIIASLFFSHEVKIASQHWGAGRKSTGCLRLWSENITCPTRTSIR